MQPIAARMADTVQGVGQRRGVTPGRGRRRDVQPGHGVVGVQASPLLGGDEATARGQRRHVAGAGLDGDRVGERFTAGAGEAGDGVCLRRGGSTRGVGHSLVRAARACRIPAAAFAHDGGRQCGGGDVGVALQEEAENAQPVVGAAVECPRQALARAPPRGGEAARERVGVLCVGPARRGVGAAGIGIHRCRSGLGGSALGQTKPVDAGALLLREARRSPSRSPGMRAGAAAEARSESSAGCMRKATTTRPIADSPRARQRAARAHCGPGTVSRRRPTARPAPVQSVPVTTLPWRDFRPLPAGSGVRRKKPT
jgi:hypothetical protein